MLQQRRYASITHLLDARFLGFFRQRAGGGEVDQLLFELASYGCCTRREMIEGVSARNADRSRSQ